MADMKLKQATTGTSHWVIAILLFILLAVEIARIPSAIERAPTEGPSIAISPTNPAGSLPPVAKTAVPKAGRYSLDTPGFLLTGQGGVVPKAFQYLGRNFFIAAPVRPPGPLTSAPVPVELLAPRLLADADDMARYIAAFPWQNYKRIHIAGFADFLVDDMKDVVKDFLRKGKVWELPLVKLIRTFALPNSVAIDAGAHIGTHTISIAQAVGPGGHVYAFEPQKKIYRELVYNLRINGLGHVTPLRFALGDKPGVIEMNVAGEGNEGNTEIGMGGDRAELRTIDSFAFPLVSFIKVDVEGFEDHVLGGAIKTIKTQHPVILVEIQGGKNFDDAPSDVRAKLVGTVKKLEDLGYYVVRVSDYDYLAIPLQK